MKRSVFLALAALVAAGALLSGLAGPPAVASPAPTPAAPGTPSAAGQAAPDVTWTTWSYRTLDNQGAVTWSGYRTFLGPGNWIIAGDYYVPQNENGHAVPEADCLAPWLGCAPKTGTTSLLILGQGESLEVNCGSLANPQQSHTCSVWQPVAGDEVAKTSDLVCQQLLDGCGLEPGGCSNGVFVTRLWWAAGPRLESQWLLPTGQVAGGTQFDNLDLTVRAGSCVPVATPTPTPTPTRTPSATPTATPTLTPPGVHRQYFPLVGERNPCQEGYILVENVRGTWRLPLNSAQVFSIGHLPWTSPTTWSVVGEIGPVRWVKYSPAPYQNVVGDSFTYPGGHPGAEFSLYWIGWCGQGHQLDNIDP